MFRRICIKHFRGLIVDRLWKLMTWILFGMFFSGSLWAEEDGLLQKKTYSILGERVSEVCSHVGSLKEQANKSQVYSVLVAFRVMLEGKQDYVQADLLEIYWALKRLGFRPALIPRLINQQLVMALHVGCSTDRRESEETLSALKNRCEKFIETDGALVSKLFPDDGQQDVLFSWENGLAIPDDDQWGCPELEEWLELEENGTNRLVRNARDGWGASSVTPTSQLVIDVRYDREQLACDPVCYGKRIDRALTRAVNGLKKSSVTNDLYVISEMPDTCLEDGFAKSRPQPVSGLAREKVTLNFSKNLDAAMIKDIANQLMYPLRKDPAACMGVRSFAVEANKPRKITLCVYPEGQEDCRCY
ncbi:MAG: hypothetical protein HQM01_01490 [Magnetococcales bacterium]|nr:hypothetical protein [Magnetococcales bacterium]